MHESLGWWARANADCSLHGVALLRLRTTVTASAKYGNDGLNVASKCVKKLLIGACVVALIVCYIIVIRHCV